MKILHFSDLHLDTPFSSSFMSAKIAQGCRLRLRQTLLKILDLAVEFEADAITIGGDLFDGDRVSRDTIQFLIGSFAQLAPIPILIAPGNHDYYSPTSPYARFDWPENVNIFTDSALQAIPLFENVRVWGMAHTLPNVRDNPLRNFHVSPQEKYHILLLHGSELSKTFEQRDQYAPFQLQDIKKAGFHFALLGHYHGTRVLSDEHAIGIYPGSPQPLSFAEQGDHCIALISLQENDIQYQCIPTATQSFIQMDFTPENVTDTHSLAEAVISAVPQRAPEANFLRLQLTGVQPASLYLQIDLLQEHLNQYFDHVDIQNNLQATEIDTSLANEHTVRGAFVRKLSQMLQEETENQELVRLALRYGLHAFEGENLIDR